MVNICDDKKTKIVVVFVLCLSLTHAHSWTYRNFNSTISRVKRQNCGFRCDNGDCISADNLCDGTAECADGSDETAGKCSNIPCPSYLFKCAYGPCINKNKVCNGIKDCADNSDETGQGCTTGSSACSPSEFRCADDKCIDAFALCDGRKDCADGSDETKEQCGKSVCPPYLLKCNYGACVDKNARCNGVQECADGSDEFGCPGEITTPKPPVTKPTDVPVPTDGCRLLSHPPNGKRSLVSNAVYVENAPVGSSTSIKIICDPGYRATDLQFDGEAYCLQGKWIGDTSADICKKTCPPLNDPTFKATCIYNSKILNCSEAVEGTTATTECISFFTYGTSRSRMACINGRWSPNLGSCVPECGIKKVNAQTLVIGGTKAIAGEYPWIVAIYSKYNNKGTFEHICGGSIISRRYVVSAAHCFSDTTTGKHYPKDNFMLIAGKYHRAFENELDKSTEQVRNFERLIIHENYRGRIQNYQYDIALIVVKEFMLNLYVQPVCIDWSQEYEDNSLSEGNNGVVAGWGYTQIGADAAAELKKVVLPIQPKRKCQEHLPEDFYLLYYTPDKICAGYINNATNVCNGDSGGGYYFRSNTKFYVRGIVSLSPSSEVGCNPNLYALYTKVSMYIEWLSNITGRYI